MKRRHFLAAAGALAALDSPQRASAQSGAPQGAKRTFVLVHGAWHGGWCWVRVADLLRGAGHTVYTPTLTGLGERAHLISPLVNLDTHINDVINLVEAEELSNVVLVGHSYAGIIISGVADRAPLRLKQLVYLDSLLLDSGQSIFSTFPKDVVKARLQSIRETGGGVGAAGFPPTAFGVKDPADVAWVSRRMTPQPVGTYQQPLILESPLGNGLPKTYVDCTLEPMVNLNPAKVMVRKTPGWQVRTLVSGHDAMVTVPGPLSALLQEIAA